MSKHTSDESKDLDIKLFEEYGNKRGGRRAISEIVKWMNYVTDNRMVLLAADLAESINVEKGSVWGTFDPVTNPTGIRMKSAIQEAGFMSRDDFADAVAASLTAALSDGISVNVDLTPAASEFIQTTRNVNSQVANING